MAHCTGERKFNYIRRVKLEALKDNDKNIFKLSEEYNQDNQPYVLNWIK